MMSPQESGVPDDQFTYSWSPLGPYEYWAKRIGADIADEIDRVIEALTEDLVVGQGYIDGLQMAQTLARKYHNFKN